MISQPMSDVGVHFLQTQQFQHLEQLGLTELTAITTNQILLWSLNRAEGAPIQIILDIPLGFVLAMLEEAQIEPEHLIVITWNRCAEYLDDLWALGPAGLISGGTQQTELIRAITAVAQGQRYRSDPMCTSPLTARERHMLRLASLGWSMEAIAESLGCRKQTVMNSFSHIYTQLGLRNRTEAVLYYWGLLPRCNGMVNEAP